MKTGILAAIVLVVALGRAAKAEERLVVDSDAIAACLDDIQIHCGDVVPGEGRIKACIKQHSVAVLPGHRRHRLIMLPRLRKRRSATCEAQGTASSSSPAAILSPEISMPKCSIHRS
jgi:hypothetical protein